MRRKSIFIRFIVPLSLGLLVLLFAATVLANVTLVSFTAVSDNGVASVYVRWETATEIETAGFYVKRSESEGGPYNNIDSFVPAQGDPVTGSTYDITDTTVAIGTVYYYKLEVVNNDQTTETYGPVSVIAGLAPTPIPTNTPTPTRTPTVTPTATQTQAPPATGVATWAPGKASLTPASTATSTPTPTGLPTATPTSPSSQTRLVATATRVTLVASAPETGETVTPQPTGVSILPTVMPTATSALPLLPADASGPLPTSTSTIAVTAIGPVSAGPLLTDVQPTFTPASPLKVAAAPLPTSIQSTLVAKAPLVIATPELASDRPTATPNLTTLGLGLIAVLLLGGGLYAILRHTGQS